MLVLLLFIAVGSLAAEDVKLVRDLHATTPQLNSDQKLKIREAQIAAMKATESFTKFMLDVQRQLETMPEYQKKKSENDAASLAYQKALQEAVASVGCSTCQLDFETLVLMPPKPVEKKPNVVTNK